ncbi:MAG: DUF6174 domain-containing protein [bacterium]
MAAFLTVSGCHDTTEAESARARWAANQPAAYVFTMKRVCFCGDIRAVVVSVRNGSVESRKYEDTGADVPGTFSALYPAVEGLFAIVNDAVARKAESIQATYDPSRGFPVQIDITNMRNAADDGLSVTVRDFKP